MSKMFDLRKLKNNAFNQLSRNFSQISQDKITSHRFEKK